MFTTTEATILRKPLRGILPFTEHTPLYTATTFSGNDCEMEVCSFSFWATHATEILTTTGSGYIHGIHLRNTVTSL